LYPNKRRVSISRQNRKKETIMSKTWKWLRIAGLVLHGLIAALLIFAASGKVLALQDAVDGMRKAGLGDQVQLIGAGELITAILLLIPRTSSLGILLASSFWGGTICFHMARGESYAMQSVLLLLTWVGAYLRLPAMFSSFTASRRDESKDVQTSTPLAA
jgi:NADH:ubiquinone oxidoreductase subunit 2 (subunit N)